VPIKNDRESHRARVHYVGHLDAVKPVLTVEENLLFWTALRGVGRGRIRAALEGFGLDPIADLPARLLSAGQRRRLALARLLAAPGELWLLDEPTVSLDAFSSTALKAAIAEHRARDGRVVVATHTSLEIPDSTRLSLERFAANRMDMAI
jgi:heme exporter protein A